MTAATFALASFLAAANVVRVTFSRLCAGRCGTLYADRATLLTLFGGRGGYGDGEKVTEEWLRPRRARRGGTTGTTLPGVVDRREPGGVRGLRRALRRRRGRAPR